MSTIVMMSRLRNDPQVGDRLDGPGFFALSQRQPREAASRLLDEVLSSGGPPGATAAGGPDWRESVRVASAVTGLDSRSRDDRTLLDLCKAFTGASSGWAHRVQAGAALVAAIRLLRFLDATGDPFKWPRPSDARVPDLAVIQGERRAVDRLLTSRCGRVVVATHENYDEDAYLSANADVRDALQPGGMAVGFDHFRIFGHAERRTMRIFRADLT